MPRKANRKFYRYVLQAHGFDGSYDRIFSTLQRINRERRIFRSDREVIFLEDISKVGDNSLVIRALGVKADKDYTTFDASNFTTSDEVLDEDKHFAIAAHGLFEIGSRDFLFEYVRSGPKIDNVLYAIQEILRTNVSTYPSLRLVATPVIDQRFLAEVNRLERVKSVRIDLAEPNAAWTDWDDPLHRLGDESGASHIALEAGAGRSRSLRKRGGILKILREALRDPNSSVKNAVVQGRFPDQSGNSVLRTDREHLYEQRSLSIDSGGSANIVSVHGALSDIADKDKL